MPPADYILQSLRAAVRFARFDARGLQLFDITLDGYWRSFAAALLVLPLSAIVQLLDFPQSPGGPLWVALVQLSEFAIGVVAFPMKPVRTSSTRIRAEYDKLSASNQGVL